MKPIELVRTAYPVGIATIVLICCYLVYKIFWPLMKMLDTLSTSATTALTKVLEKIGKAFTTVWDWTKKMRDSNPEESLENQKDNEAQRRLSLNFVISGIIAVGLTVLGIMADFYLLKLSFEVVFQDLPLIPGGIDFIAASAITMMVALVVAGIMWRDSDLLLSESSHQRAVSQVGGWGILILVILSMMLATLRAKVIGNQPIPAAALMGLVAAVYSGLIAYAGSFAYRNLIFPVGQRLVNAFLRALPYLGVAVKFLASLCVWAVLAMLILIISSAYALLKLPALLIMLRNYVVQWYADLKKRKDELRIERERRRQVIQKWKQDCRIAIMNGEPIPPPPQF